MIISWYILPLGGEIQGLLHLIRQLRRPELLRGSGLDSRAARLQASVEAELPLTALENVIA